MTRKPAFRVPKPNAGTDLCTPLNRFNSSESQASMQIYGNLFLFIGIGLLVAVTTSLQVGNTGDANDEDGTEYNCSSRRRRGRSQRVEERDKIILQIRRENPDWTYKRVAAEAQYKFIPCQLKSTD